jgi:hypothetical protein
MPRSNFTISAFVVSVYALLATIVQQGISRLGGAPVLQEIPSWAFLLIGPMIPLGIGHGVEFFLLASVTCMPLLICGLISKTTWVRWVLLLSAVVIWVGIGYLLGF